MLSLPAIIATLFAQSSVTPPPPPPPKPPIIEPILYYDSGALRHRPENQHNLDTALNYMRTGNPTRILITSRTDTVGSAEDNLLLSRRRAEVIADIFIAGGADPSIIQIDAVGENALAKQTGDGVPEPLNRLIWVAINF